MSLPPVYLTALALILTAANATAADTKATIRKCQDATGKWHYGDRAADECGRSKIEVISEQGVTKREIAAPPTEAELAERERRKDETEREQHNAAEQAKRDKILLQTYAVEDDIVLVRDRKLSQIEATIKASEETLKSLRNALTRMETQKQTEDEKNDKKSSAQTEKGIAQTKAQIERHEAVVTQKRQEQEKLRKQYAEELKRYRELKLQLQTKSPTKKSPTP
jgi:hypothetical protein